MFPMNRILLVLLAILFTASSAHAAAIFNKPKKDNALPDAVVEQPAPEAQPIPQAVPEAAAPAAAPAEETIESFAERYMQNCLKKQDPVLKGEALRMLCACSASKLQEKMTVEEVKAMMTDTPEGLAQRNRMAVHVYAPCMEYPAKALMMSRCEAYKENLSKAQNGEAICACFANNMALYTSANAQTVMAQQLMANPHETDPLGAFMNSAEYKKQTDATLVSCVNSNGGLTP
jgi:hypothetical protein